MNARRTLLACLVVPVLLSLAPNVRSAQGDPFPVSIKVDAATSRGELKPIWRFFGADEPNYAYMKDGRKLLAALGQLGTPQVYFRTHNLLNTGDGAPALKWGSTNAYTEDSQGKPVYDWTIVDRIFDAYLQRGVKPVRADRVHAAGSVGQAGALPARVAPGSDLQRRLHRLGPSAEGLRQVGRAGLPVGQAQRREVRPRRGGALVLGGLERAQHRLLAGDAPGVPQASRLRRGRRAPRPAHGPGRRAGHGGPRRPVPARLPRALPARHQLRHRRQGHPDRLHRLPRQGRAAVPGRPCPDGDRPPAAGDRPGDGDHRVASRS